MKTISVLLIFFSVLSFAQVNKMNAIKEDSVKTLKLNEINSYLNLATKQVFINNNGFKKEINYFSRLPFGENTIGNYDFKRENMNKTFIESLTNILLNSKKQ